MRVAILGMGAIGHVIARALDGRADLVKVDRTHAPLRDGESPVDAWPAVWRKVVTNAAVNPLTALTRRTNAELLADAPASSVADSIAREVARVATATGVPIEETEAVTQWRSMAALTGANRSSMLQDVEAGRPTEIDAISGAVAREGERRGVAAPLNQAMTLPVSALVRRD